MISASLNGIPDAFEKPIAAGVPGVGDGDDEIGVDRRLASQALPHPHPGSVNLDAAEARVGTREVDVLEDAERVSSRRARLRAVQASVIDPDHLARPHVAHDLGSDQVEGARLRGNDPVLADLTQRQRTEAERIAEGDEDAVGDRRRGVRALETGHRARDGLLQRSGVAGDESGDDLRVGPGAEPNVVLEELGPQLLDVHEVAVVPERDGSRSSVVDQRLRVRPPVRARRRVPRVPDGELARKGLELLLVEDLRHEAHVADDRQPSVVGDSDPGRLLTAMLEREEPEVREARDVALLRADPEDAAHG